MRYLTLTLALTLALPAQAGDTASYLRGESSIVKPVKQSPLRPTVNIRQPEKKLLTFRKTRISDNPFPKLISLKELEEEAARKASEAFEEANKARIGLKKGRLSARPGITMNRFEKRLKDYWSVKK